MLRSHLWQVRGSFCFLSIGTENIWCLVWNLSGGAMSCSWQWLWQVTAYSCTLSCNWQWLLGACRWLNWSTALLSFSALFLCSFFSWYGDSWLWLAWRVSVWKYHKHYKVGHLDSRFSCALGFEDWKKVLNFIDTVSLTGMSSVQLERSLVTGSWRNSNPQNWCWITSKSNYGQEKGNTIKELSPYRVVLISDGSGTGFK